MATISTARVGVIRHPENRSVFTWEFVLKTFSESNYICSKKFRKLSDAIADAKIAARKHDVDLIVPPGIIYDVDKEDDSQ